MSISTALRDRIAAAARASPAIEVCGLLFGEPDAIKAMQLCRNVAADPSTAFEIDPAALIAAHRAARAGGPRLIGCYHSHPAGSAEPSWRDAADAAPDGALWLIVGGGEFSAWRAVARGERHGRFDPVTLACTPDSRRPIGP